MEMRRLSPGVSGAETFIYMLIYRLPEECAMLFDASKDVPTQCAIASDNGSRCALGNFN